MNANGMCNLSMYDNCMIDKDCSVFERDINNNSSVEIKESNDKEIQ